MAFTRVRGPGITTDDNYRVGIITATKFVGPMQASGDSDFTNISATGIGTIDGVKIGDPSGIVTASSSSGIVTYYGDASKLTGLTAGQIPNLAASKITSGTIDTARLGSGTANSTSFLRGDQSWAAVTSTTINNNGNDRIITGSASANTLEGEANLQFDGTNLFMPNELRHLGDPDTKMGFDTDTIKFETDGNERLRITSNGKTFIHGTGATGANNTSTLLPNGYTLNIHGTSSNDGISVVRYSADYGAYGINIGKSNNSTFGTNTLVTDGEELGHVSFYGADGTDFNMAAQITGEVDGTPSDGTDMPGALTFKTSSEASGTPTERLRITSGGDFGVGTASPTARLDVRRSDADGKIAEFHQSTGYGIDIGSSQALAYISSGYNQNWAFKTDPGSGQVERLRITSDGKVSISSDGTADGLLTIKGNSDATGTPSIRLLDGGDTREVSISNESGDFIASVHGTDNAAHGHIKMFESGIFDINNGGASGSNTNRLRIHADGKFSVGTSSSGFGQWSFVNQGSSGGDATGGETGLTIRSDEGFTNTDVTGSDNWTLKLRNNAYAGGGVSGNQGTVSKILFSAVTSNGHNSFVNIGCDTQGTGSSKGDFFVVPGGGSEALRITSGGMSKFTRNSTGTVGHFYANARECNILLQNDARTWKIVNYDYGNNGTDHLGFHDGTADRLIIGNAGQLGLSGTNYGSSGQILTSGGSSGACQWASPSLTSDSFQAEQVTDQTMGTNAWNLVKFNAQNWDTGNNYDHTNGNWYYTAPSTGKYWYKASLELIDLGQDKRFGIGLYIDTGSGWTQQRKTMRWVYQPKSGNNVASIETTGLTALSSGNKIRVYCYHDHGSNRDLDDNWCIFEMFRLGD